MVPSLEGDELDGQTDTHCGCSVSEGRGLGILMGSWGPAELSDQGVSRPDPRGHRDSALNVPVDR